MKTASDQSAYCHDGRSHPGSGRGKLWSPSQTSCVKGESNPVTVDRKACIIPLCHTRWCVQRHTGRKRKHQQDKKKKDDTLWWQFIETMEKYPWSKKKNYFVSPQIRTRINNVKRAMNVGMILILPASHFHCACWNTIFPHDRSRSLKVMGIIVFCPPHPLHRTFTNYY